MGDAQTANASPPAPPAASFFQPLHPLGTWCDFSSGHLVEGARVYAHSATACVATQCAARRRLSVARREMRNLSADPNSGGAALQNLEGDLAC